MTSKTRAIVETYLKAKDLTSPHLIKIARNARLAAVSVRGVASGIGAIAKASALAAGAVAGVGFGLKRVADGVAGRADEFAKFSRQVGISAQTLQEFEFAASRQGASYENLTSGITAMTKRMGELKSGTGSLASFLKKSDKAFLKQLEGVESNEEAMELLLEKIASIPDEQKKMALASAAFSRGAGKDFVRLLANGAEGLEQIRKEARWFRPPLPPSALTAAEDYQDSMFNASEAVKSVGDMLGVKLMPVLGRTAQSMANWIASNREFLGQKIDEFVGAIATQLNGVNWEAVATNAADFAIAFANAPWAEIASAVGLLAANIDKVVIALGAFAAIGGLKMLSGLLDLGGGAGGKGGKGGRGGKGGKGILGRFALAGVASMLLGGGTMVTPETQKPPPGVVRRWIKEALRGVHLDDSLTKPFRAPDKGPGTFFDLADDHKAHRGTGRTSIDDDGTMRHMQDFIGATTSELQAQFDRMGQILTGAVDFNITVRVEGNGEVTTVGTTNNSALVGNVGTNAPGYSAGGGGR